METRQSPSRWRRRIAWPTDVVSLETMRSAMVNNFEQNDLDVPAFLRKRNDVM